MAQQRRNMSNNSTSTEEQQHYNRLTSFLLWALGVTGTLIAVMAGFAIFISFSDRKAMKDDYSNYLKESKDEIAQIKEDATKTEKEIRENANYQVKQTEEMAYNQMKRTQELSDKQISLIISQTNNVALTETQKQIAEAFNTDRIQEVIKNQAVKEIKSKITELVNQSTKNIIPINNAATEMRIGRTKGMKLLKTYFEHPANSQDSLFAKRTYDDICRDYNDNALKLVNDNQYPYQGYLTNYFEFQDFVSFSITENSIPPDYNEKKSLQLLIDVINNKDEKFDLKTVSLCYAILSRASKKNFYPFDVKKVNTWFEHLNK